MNHPDCSGHHSSQLSPGTVLELQRLAGNAAGGEGGETPEHEGFDEESENASNKALEYYKWRWRPTRVPDAGAQLGGINSGGARATNAGPAGRARQPLRAWPAHPRRASSPSPWSGRRRTRRR